MPYTKSVLEEQLKMGERLPVGWPWRLLIFAVIFFGAMVFLYSGMTFGYKPYLNSRVKGLNKEISNLTESIGEEQQKNLIGFYSQLVNAQNLLANHPTASKLLDFLEKNTHSQISYLSLNLSLAEKKLKLEGNAFDYKVLVQQLELFRRAPEIDKVFLDDSKQGETGTGIRFSIQMIFKPELVI
ncbi:MAG: hypothetical protein AAB696_01625 [Patescibacteria group bacterium]